MFFKSLHIVCLFAFVFPTMTNLELRAEEVFEREPYDTLVLKRGGTELEVLPLDLPGRRAPNPLPSGKIEVRMVDNPSVPLEVSWNSVEKLILFEQRLFDEAERLIDQRNLDSAYGRLYRLHQDYPNYPRLDQTWTAFLKADAFDKFSKKKYDHALAVLQALYDRDPNASGVRQAVEVVGQEILESAWQENDYEALGATLRMLSTHFSGLKLRTVDTWRERIESRFQETIAEAESALAAGDHRLARQRARDASAVMPDDMRIAQLLERINQAYPVLRIGILGANDASTTPRLDAPGGRRVQRLLGGNLAQLDGYGPNGGVYSTPLGKISSSPDGREIRVILDASVGPVGPYELTHELLQICSDREPMFGALVGRAQRIQVEPQAEVVVRLKRSHPRPESLLKGPLPSDLRAIVPANWRLVNSTTEENLYQRLDPSISNEDFDLILETFYEDGRTAADALLGGEIDLLANPPPWQLERLRTAKEIKLTQYRVPTLHCLLLSPDSRLRTTREARRAYCYALPRTNFVDSVLLAGASEQGFLVVSGPFSAGRTLGDPLRYGYNEAFAPRTYQPRLAALLAAVAQKASAVADQSAPLVLIHPPSPVARTACRSLEASMKSLGIVIELKELPERKLVESPPPHDLRYAEIQIGEPMVDAWPLLGPGGLAGDCSATMLIQLQQLHRASSTTEVSDILKQIHELAYGELPLIPLWQTVDYFAYHESLIGLPEESIDLYQTIDDWNRTMGVSR